MWQDQIKQHTQWQTVERKRAGWKEGMSLFNFFFYSPSLLLLLSLFSSSTLPLFWLLWCPWRLSVSTVPRSVTILFQHPTPPFCLLRLSSAIPLFLYVILHSSLFCPLTVCRVGVGGAVEWQVWRDRVRGQGTRLQKECWMWGGWGADRGCGVWQAFPTGLHLMGVQAVAVEERGQQGWGWGGGWHWQDTGRCPSGAERRGEERSGLTHCVCPGWRAAAGTACPYCAAGSWSCAGSSHAGAGPPPGCGSAPRASPPETSDTHAQREYQGRRERWRGKKETDEERHEEREWERESESEKVKRRERDGEGERERDGERDGETSREKLRRREKFILGLLSLPPGRNISSCLSVKPNSRQIFYFSNALSGRYHMLHRDAY